MLCTQFALVVFLLVTLRNAFDVASAPSLGDALPSTGACLSSYATLWSRSLFNGQRGAFARCLRRLAELTRWLDDHAPPEGQVRTLQASDIGTSVTKKLKF